ncbi:L,D-transpeptidase family protein [Streptomyces sp. GZWMJZ-114]|uniref:L,D-transpeptidase family protein n=1 Tax=Streptomyces sp. GZWMJZ-114 TaxID=2494734 RepID=UPI001011CABB|nr:L,D-transpeptidase family protein [Streptomyces sp. GZWMJZ-114]
MRPVLRLRATTALSLLPALLLGPLTAPALAAPQRAAAPRAEAQAPPLPARLADTGGARQLLIATAPDTRSTHGTLTWWERRADGEWRARGRAAARFGAGGLVEGTRREQGTNTTPTGLFGLPFAFGNEAAPKGTRLAYRPVTPDSWWCEDNASRAYNRWSEPRAADCRAEESERLADYPVQYAHAFVTDFNYRRPVRGRGAGIFLHVNGKGATAGCVSVPAATMRTLLRWARPGAKLVVGTEDGGTAVTRY